MEKILNLIEPFKKFNIKLIESNDSEIVTMSIPLNGNLNDKKTMFAGSIYSVMVLTGWVLAYSLCNKEKIKYDVVIKESKIDYLSPIKSDAKSIAKFQKPLIINKNGNICYSIKVEIFDNNSVLSAILIGEYRGIKK